MHENTKCIDSILHDISILTLKRGSCKLGKHWLITKKVEFYFFREFLQWFFLPIVLPESVFSFSKTGNRFNESFFRHLFQQRSASGWLQAENHLHVRSSKDWMKFKRLQQSAGMRCCFCCKWSFNVRFFSFNVRFLIFNVRFFFWLKGAADMQCTIMERVLLF